MKSNKIDISLQLINIYERLKEMMPNIFTRLF